MIDLNYGLTPLSSHVAPAYDGSFLKKNNIILRLVFFHQELPPIDVMVVLDTVNVINVARNFDLSFCEIWFDGQNVYAVDPDSINQKKGILKPDYLESLFVYHNEFIKKRIKKYLKRGFEINYSRNPCTFLTPKKEIKQIKTPNGTVTVTNINRELMYPEEWVVKKIYSAFLKEILEDDNTDIINSYILSEFTVENLFKMIKNYYNIVDPDIYSFDGPRLRSDGPIRPEIAQKMINKKVKLLITYFIYDLRSIEGDDNYRRWLSYFDMVLNFNEEDFLVEFNSEDELDPIDTKMLTDVIFVDNLNDDIERSVILVKEFYKKLNIRTPLKTINKYCILDDFKIIVENNTLETARYPRLDQYLREDPNNFVLLISKEEASLPHTDFVKGYGLNSKDLYEKIYSTLIYSTRELSDPVEDSTKWYKRLSLSFNDFFDVNILLSKINTIKDELNKPNGTRIFYLTNNKTRNCIRVMDKKYNQFYNNIVGREPNRYISSIMNCYNIYDDVFLVNRNQVVSSQTTTPAEILSEEVNLESLFPGFNEEMIFNLFLRNPEDFVVENVERNLRIGDQNVRRRLTYDDESSISEEDDDEEDNEDNTLTLLSLINRIPQETEELETEDIDESRLPNNCFDFSMYDEQEISTYLNDPDAFIFVTKDLEDNIGDAFCFSKETLRNIINDDDKWLYECGGPYIRGTQDRTQGVGVIDFPYVKIPIDREGGFNAYIPLYKLNIILNTNDKIFYIVPMMQDGIQKMITHTINRKLYLGRNITQTDYFGANHCQNGSSILVYDVKVCRDPERCITSILYRTDRGDSDESDDDDIKIKMLLNKD